jgi:hypothetical protein
MELAALQPSAHSCRSCMRITYISLTFCLLACSQTNSYAPSAGSEAPPQDSGTDAAQELDAHVDNAVPCSAETRPGDACDSTLGAECSVTHCGVRRPLSCSDGAWALAPSSWQSESSPFDFVCTPEADESTDFCENTPQCCGQELEDPSACALEGGCELCPAEEPVDGAPCTLPPACDGQPEPRVIDCYYECCCYGSATWAQCDGERWHIDSNCTPK